MCKKATIQEFWNSKLTTIIGVVGTFANTYQGLFHVVAKKGGRIILGFSKAEEIDGSNIENVVEVGGGAAPYVEINGACKAKNFNNGITEVVEIGDKILTIEGGVITKVEGRK